MGFRILSSKLRYRNVIRFRRRSWNFSIQLLKVRKGKMQSTLQSTLLKLGEELNLIWTPFNMGAYGRKKCVPSNVNGYSTPKPFEEFRWIKYQRTRMSYSFFSKPYENFCACFCVNMGSYGKTGYVPLTRSPRVEGGGRGVCEETLKKCQSGNGFKNIKKNMVRCAIFLWFRKSQ